MKPGGPENLIGEQREEKSQANLIERICRNVEVVETMGVRKYRVTWRGGVEGVGGRVSGKGDMVFCYFDTAQQVINQHERVLEKYLGTEIPLAAGKILAIPGETQKMTEISQQLSSLAAQFIIPLTPQASAQLRERVLKIKEKIGRVTNEYKQKAQVELVKTLFSKDERGTTEAMVSANLAILERTKESLGIVSGTNSRLLQVTRRRNEWEEIISQTFYEMAQIVKNLADGVYDNHPRKREQLARHISGESEYSLIGKLNLISGPEYWERIQSREVQKLKEVGDLLREGKNEEAKKKLTAAILKLERVVKEKEGREKGKSEQ
jgi:hypothetical protein